MLEGLVGLIIWLCGNYFYYEFRKEGERSGFKRFIAFWMGFPLTIVSFLIVPMGKSPLLKAPPSEGDSLLEEIRRDRALRDMQERLELARGVGEPIGDPPPLSDDEVGEGGGDTSQDGAAEQSEEAEEGEGWKKLSME